MKALLCGWHHAPADELVRQITEYHRIRRHDAVVDAVLLAALDAATALLPAALQAVWLLVTTGPSPCRPSHGCPLATHT